MKSYRHPGATWLGSPNFTADRDGHDMSIQPAWVVLHTMVGSVGSANARFQQASEQASATYGVGLDGKLYQWVDERDGPWANGNTGTGGVGDNLDSVAIEHEDNGDYNGPRTPALYAASAALVRDVCQRYGIPIDRQHVIGHRECTRMAGPTACPDALDVDRIVAMAQQEDPFMAGPLSDPATQQQLIDAVTAAKAQAADNRLVLGVLYNLLVFGRTHAPTGGPDSVPDLPDVEEATLAGLQQAIDALKAGAGGTMIAHTHDLPGASGPAIPTPGA